MSADATSAGDGLPGGRKQLTPVHRLLAGICAVLLLAMMAVTVIDVLGRYLFHSPLTGATEITAMLLAGVIFIGLPAVSLDNSHVSVDLLVDFFPDRLQPLRVLAINLLSAGVLVAVAWRLLVYGQGMASYGERTVSLHLPVAPLAFLCAALTALAAAITLAHVFKPLFR